MASIAPEDLLPSGCSDSLAWKFQIRIENIITTARRSLLVRRSDALLLTLTQGVLVDQQERTGYISSTGQLQFDYPAPSDALWTDGFSACTDGFLYLAGAVVWRSCLSGGVSNLYINDQPTADCTKQHIRVVAADDAATSSAASTSAAAEVGRSVIVVTVSRTAMLDADPTGTFTTSASFSRITESASIATTGPPTSLRPLAVQTSQNAEALSTGVRIGIGAGVGLTALLLLLVGAVLFRWRRRRRLRIRASTPPYATTVSGIGYEDGVEQVHEKDGRERKMELDGEEVFEADGQEKQQKTVSAVK